tara:strand:- start:8601 stop:8981 length:381 start_codon:yes stop_codon:yes gene_type:complete
MEPINLPPLGQIQVRQPKSFAAVYDVMNVYWNITGQPNKMGRLICAALGMCWSDENEGKKPPRYNVAECDPVAYGGEMMDWLANQQTPVDAIYRLGQGFILEMAKMLPSGEEVEAEKDFTEVGADG